MPDKVPQDRVQINTDSGPVVYIRKEVAYAERDRMWRRAIGSGADGPQNPDDLHRRFAFDWEELTTREQDFFKAQVNGYPYV